jgi:hypothetical protein
MPVNLEFIKRVPRFAPGAQTAEKRKFRMIPSPLSSPAYSSGSDDDRDGSGKEVSHTNNKKPAVAPSTLTAKESADRKATKSRLKAEGINSMYMELREEVYVRLSALRESESGIDSLKHYFLDVPNSEQAVVLGLLTLHFFQMQEFDETSLSFLRLTFSVSERQRMGMIGVIDKMLRYERKNRAKLASSNSVRYSDVWAEHLPAIVKACCNGITSAKLTKVQKFLSHWRKGRFLLPFLQDKVESAANSVITGRAARRGTSGGTTKRKRERDKKSLSSRHKAAKEPRSSSGQSRWIMDTLDLEIPVDESEFFLSVTPPPRSSDDEDFHVEKDEARLRQEEIEREERARERMRNMFPLNVYNKETDENRRRRSLGRYNFSFVPSTDLASPVSERARSQCMTDIMIQMKVATKCQDEKIAGKLVGNWMFDLVHIRSAHGGSGRKGPKLDPVFQADNYPALKEAFNHRFKASNLIKSGSAVSKPEEVSKLCDKLYKEVICGHMCAHAEKIGGGRQRDGKVIMVKDASQIASKHPLVKLVLQGTDANIKLLQSKYDQLKHEFLADHAFENHKGTSQTEQQSTDLFHTRLFCMQLRYETLFANNSGSQGAVPPIVFDLLRKLVNVDGECFASPLNHTLPLYFSAFPDVDQPFGSLGSFFDDRYNVVVSGCWECNPPFDIRSISRALEKMQTSLAAAEQHRRSLTFIVFFNHTDNPLLLGQLADLKPFTRGQRLLKEHCYMHGFHHTEAYNEYWRSERQSLFSLFQTTGGYAEHCHSNPHRVNWIMNQVEHAFSLNLVDVRSSKKRLYKKKKE